jgi:hypothetical protein
MYNLSAYYIARTFADIPAELINTLLFVIIAYWFGGLKHDAGAFFGLLFRWATGAGACVADVGAVTRQLELWLQHPALQCLSAEGTAAFQPQAQAATLLRTICAERCMH